MHFRSKAGAWVSTFATSLLLAPDSFILRSSTKKLSWTCAILNDIEFVLLKAVAWVSTFATLLALARDSINLRRLVPHEPP